LAALRRLENIYRDKPRTGQAVRPAEEPVRFAQEPTLSFAPTTLHDLVQGEDGRPPRLTEYFFGLLGPQGPLPLHLTEYAYDRLHNFADPTFVRFLDVFHHRMLALFYRAWADAEPTVNFDRPENDRFSGYIASLIGYGLPSLRDRDAMPDLAKLHYSGRLVGHTRHPEGLRAMLVGFFGVTVTIREFVGDWMTIPEDSRLRLGESRTTGTLGLSSVIGGRVWGCHQKFRIRVGPLDMADYQRLLPRGDSLKRLVAIVKNYLGEEFAWDVNLVLKKQQVQPTELGRFGQLGWDTWLTPRPQQTDADDLMLRAVH
jgi:type VI secretion system protein ImpH